MNLHDAHTLAALAQLDPAPRSGDGEPASLTPSEARRAAAELDRIVAVGPGTPGPPAGPVSRPTRRPYARRWLLAPLVVLLAGAAAVVPALTTSGDKAYATWSPLPVALTPVEGAVAARACLATLGQAADPRLGPMLAERRGGWTYVLIRPAARLQASCIMPTVEISATPAGDRRRWFGSSDEEIPDPVSDPEEVRVDTAATGSTQEGLFSYSEGAVGRDVADVTLTTPRGVTVKASIGNGRYAAWWPAGSNYLRSPEISGASDIDVTLTDGTTYRLPR
jgi:hypothetical protein